MKRRILLPFALLSLSLLTFEANAENDAWYVGLEAAHNQCGATFHTTSLNIMPGIYGGYRINNLVSVELSATFGRSTLKTRSCCENSWLSADGDCYNTSVIDSDGAFYSDIRSKVNLQKYRLRANFDILSLFLPAQQWSVTLTPSIGLIHTSTHVRPTYVDKLTKTHFGYGIAVGAGYKIDEHITVGVFSGVTGLTGAKMDAMPAIYHNDNIIWETGVKLSWTFKK